MKHLFAKKKQELRAPVNGILCSLSDVADEVFSSQCMGTGFAIHFDGTQVVAPAAATIMACYPTGHALGLKTAFAEIILHIGIDTVECNGDGFHLCVEQGQHVEAGDVLVRVNAEFIKEKGYDPITMMIFPNRECFQLLPYGTYVKENEVIATCGKG